MKKHKGYSVDDIKVIETRGPWKTKSGGELNVMFAVGVAEQKKFFSYKNSELRKMPCDLRGLRTYTVRNLPAGNIGGTEWHRIRQEMLFTTKGFLNWEFEDVFGGTRDLLLSDEFGVWIPPYILHTYRVEEEGSGILVVANTLFIPDDPRTHDTYPTQEFRELQKKKV